MSSGESDGVLLLIDGWSGDITELRDFLGKYSIHVAPRSELYATEPKAGIGADGSSFDPPLPRFLGSQVNDTSLASKGFGSKIPLSRIVLCCDPYTYYSNKLGSFFTT